MVGVGTSIRYKNVLSCPAVKTSTGWTLILTDEYNKSIKLI